MFKREYSEYWRSRNNLKTQEEEELISVIFNSWRLFSVCYVVEAYEMLYIYFLVTMLYKKIISEWVAIIWVWFWAYRLVYRILSKVFTFYTLTTLYINVFTENFKRNLDTFNKIFPLCCWQWRYIYLKVNII